MMNLQKLRGKKGIIVGENYSNSLLDCLNSVDSKILIDEDIWELKDSWQRTLRW